MASTSSSVGLGQGHTCCPARVARCFRGAACPYMLRGRCWFDHDDLDGVPPCRDVAATSCRVDAATASDLLVRVRRLERIVEKIGSVLVPQIMKGDVEGCQQNSVVEQIVGAPAPQTWEPVGERVQNCFLEQFVGILVPQLMEAVVDVMLTTPQERVQHRTQEQIADSPVPQIMEAVLPSAPQELVQIRTQEQIVVCSVPQLLEECVQNRTPEQIVDFPVPQIMEAPVDVLLP